MKLLTHINSIMHFCIFTFLFWDFFFPSSWHRFPGAIPLSVVPRGVKAFLLPGNQFLLNSSYPCAIDFHHPILAVDIPAYTGSARLLISVHETVPSLLALTADLTQPRVTRERSLNRRNIQIRLGCGHVYGVGWSSWLLFDVRRYSLLRAAPFPGPQSYKKLAMHEPMSEAWISLLALLSDEVWPGSVSQINAFFPCECFITTRKLKLEHAGNEKFYFHFAEPWLPLPWSHPCLSFPVLVYMIHLQDFEGQTSSYCDHDENLWSIMSVIFQYKQPISVCLKACL